MWLIISVLKLTVASVISVPYGYNNYNSHSQVYHPVNYEPRQIIPYLNKDVKISHILPTVNKDYGLMQYITPPHISNVPNHYSFVPVHIQVPLRTQPSLQYYIAPAIARQHFSMPTTPRTNYLSPVVPTKAPLIKLNIAEPTKKTHDLEYQNTQNFEKAYGDADDDADEYLQENYSAGSSHKQQTAKENNARDQQIQKPKVKLPERKDRIDFQVYGFDGPKSYKFGYDTGKGENRQFRYETRDRDGNVSGRYGYVDRTGKLNVVKYTSNADDGFRTETL